LVNEALKNGPLRILYVGSNQNMTRHFKSLLSPETARIVDLADYKHPRNLIKLRGRIYDLVIVDADEELTRDELNTIRATAKNRIAFFVNISTVRFPA